MFVRNGAVTPRPSRECDITFFVKGWPKAARQSRDSTVAARRAQSVTVPSSRVSRECRSPGLRSPPLKNARDCVNSAFSLRKKTVNELQKTWRNSTWTVKSEWWPLTSVNFHEFSFPSDSGEDFFAKLPLTQTYDLRNKSSKKFNADFLSKYDFHVYLLHPNLGSVNSILLRLGFNFGLDLTWKFRTCSRAYPKNSFIWPMSQCVEAPAENTDQDFCQNTVSYTNIYIYIYIQPYII